MEKKVPHLKRFAASMLIAAGSLFTMTSFAQQGASDNFPGAAVAGHSKLTGLPNFFRFNPGSVMNEAQVMDWFRANMKFNESVSFKPYSRENDKLGYTLVRYKEYVGAYPLDGSMMLAHLQDGKAVSLNGDYYNQVPASFSASLTETKALQFALNYVHAAKYKWDNKAEELAMKESTNNPLFTYYPVGTLAVVHKTGNDYSSSSLRLAWKFDIYAEAPLSRAYIYVDANTGEVISKENRIHDANVVGTANTVYSGSVTMTSDNYATNAYRLRETGRGNGIQTYNLATSTTYSNTDFTNNSSTWNLAPPDNAATDAHWGAEMTYDYYNTVHSRNSIDGAGYALLSYVHYSTNYANAFWDGTRMTYGDGNTSQGFTIMTGLDVCGHEITHGLTSFTAALNGGGTGEADALNEGNSDIFGTTIERYARPTQWDWIMGEDITTSHLGIRTMSNPHNSANPGPQPNTYMGQYWDPAGEPHNNNGPFIYWYYLLCQGGSGTNDNSQVYNVTGITMAEARLIQFRALTVYFTPSTTYNDARTYTIQAANDIYGACSPEVIATTNAWYAVGVGPQFSATVTAAFGASTTTSCSVPVTINFSNTSTNAGNALWDFGDATTSTVFAPSHTYTAPGTYTVKLKVSGACGSDSTVRTSYIVITTPQTPAATGAEICTAPGSVTLHATGSGTLNWFANATGGTALATGTSFTTPSLPSTTTYYVEDDAAGTSGNVGPVNHTFGTGGYHNNTSTQYLIFDVLQSCTLQTVWVDAGAAGSRTFTLWDNAGTQISQVVVNIPNGTSTVTLNLHLNAGTGFRLGGTSMNLYRNNSGAAYPYTLSGLINMTGSSAGAAFYYYCYNWHVQADPCTSVRVPVVATIGGPTVTYSATGYDTVCVNHVPFSLTGQSPAGGTFSGTGVSAGMFNPSVAGVGTTTVTYSYTDANSCTNIATQVLHVIGCITGIHDISTGTFMNMYPNPASSQVTVEITVPKDGTASLSLINELGQTVLSQQTELKTGMNKLNLNMESIARGVYFMRMQTADGVFTRRLIRN